MSFLKKLFGSGDSSRKGDSQQEKASARAARPPSDDKPRPRVPTLADLSPRPLHSYFEYVGGDSSKFYAVSLEEEDGGTWRVRFNFGRIGFPRAWAAKVEGASWAKAAKAYTALVDERTGKGYEIRPWPASLKLPDGEAPHDDAGTADEQREQVLFRAATRGTLPPATGGIVGDIPLPDGTLYSPEPSGGSRGEAPVVWASQAPVPGVGRLWARLAAVFPETGLWPFVIDAEYGFRGFDDYLMDIPRGRHKEVAAVLRRGWTDNTGFDDDFPDEVTAPYGPQFPGLADPTPGDRPNSIDHIVAALSGHFGLAALNRPADILDAIGWMGAANYDGDPLDMTTVLRSWEQRFDAYVIGLGPDTLHLAVGRPARDLSSATAIAAEHFAFCPDNIQQGVGTIREYAEMLVNEEHWAFWWD